MRISDWSSDVCSSDLLAHHPHRKIDAASNDRLTQARNHARECARETTIIRTSGKLAGDDQPPSGRVDEHGAPVSPMRCPVAGCDLVADQRVSPRGIGTAEECFGEAHTGAALLTAERIFRYHTLHT